MEYSVIIPVFNEEKSLTSLQKELHETMEKTSCEYEIIYVNDGSRDSSLEVLQKLREDYPKIRIVSFEENRGQSAALFSGFKASRGKWIFTMDADCQNPPEDFLKLLEFKDDFDFITGIRKNRKDDALRRISSSVARFFRWLVLRDSTKDTGCSLRIFKREIIDSITYFKNFHRFFTFLVRAKGFSVKESSVTHRRRLFGKSKYGILKRTQEGIRDIIKVRKQQKT